MPRAGGSQSRGKERRARSNRRSGSPDALALLRADHRKVRRLLAALSSAHAPRRREQLYRKVESAIKAHTRAEEDIFYPAYHEAVHTKQDRQLFYEATEEHRAVDLVLADLKQADVGSDTFAARVKVLRELIEHHVHKEEQEMFPRARKATGSAALAHLGAEIAACAAPEPERHPLRAVSALLSKPFAAVMGAN